MNAMMPFLLALLAQVQPLVIPGERLSYEVTSSRMGKIGTALLTTTRADDVVRLEFETNAKILLFKAADKTTSELDAVSLRTLRYTKRERSPVGKRDETVSVDYATGAWSDGKTTHQLACNAALDELSVIFLLRSMDLIPGEERVITRHFDLERNPIKVRLVSSTEQYDVIEMTVPDKRQNSGTSTLRFYLSPDEKRVPLRIESNMPVAGRIVMVLK